jgi:PAS domain S-box-containing protein
MKSRIATGLLRSALLCAAYYGAALLGLHYASIGQSISLVWPPTGIAIAALTLWGPQYWPAVAMGAFLANAATPVSLAAAAAIAVGNTLEAIVASSLLRRAAGSHSPLDHISQVRTFLVVAAPLGTLCSALIGSLSLALSGSLIARDVPGAIIVWWTGDLLGAFIVAPLILAWMGPPQSQRNPRRLAEILLLCAGTIVAGEVGLGGFLDTPLLAGVMYPYLLFPFVIWAALRFGVRGASLMTFTVAAAAVGHTIAGASPFASPSSTRTLFEVALYMVAVAVTGLVLAAAVQWERQHATEVLAESQQRLRRALDAARMGIWFWSIDNGTLSWDENLRQLYGLNPEDRISGYEDFLARVHPDDRERVQAAVRRALESGGELNYEFRIVLPDGRIRWIADHGETRRNHEGRTIYLTGICADVTDRKVTEEKLRQAHRMESVGRLAGGVAHEANNQMSVVLGASSFILKRKDVSEAVRADVEFIQKAAERTAAVTAQLLAFSRRQVLRPEVLDINGLITGWEPVLRRIMGEDRGVVLRLSDQLAPVKADPGQLEQVLLNLALNARDAMPRGGRISIETFPRELTAEYMGTKPGTSIAPGKYVVVAMSDTGHGMDKGTLSHIFEPFFTTKGVGQGTGLGLSMVYGIVKQSGGYIWVYSEPGQGTTFKIYLPEQPGPISPARRDSTPARAMSNETVLVVEDEDGLRYMMSRALEDAGYTVLQAGGAAEALDLLTRSQEKISLLLTDIVMPGQNGRDLAERVAELRPSMRVLFTSGYTDGEIEQRGLLRPGAAFIQKPLTPRSLVRAVQKILDRTTHQPTVPGDAALL